MRLLLVATLLFWFYGATDTQVRRVPRPKDLSGDPAAPKEGLELTTSIARQELCQGTMGLTLRLSYKNTTDHNLILFKYNLAAYQQKVSRSVEAADAEDYEWVLYPTILSVAEPHNFGDEPPTEFFVILKPGESYTPINDVNVSFHVVQGKGEDSEDDRQAGPHVLQINVRTWLFTADPEAETRARWRPFGTLWTAPLLSKPMPFRIDEPQRPSMSDCNK
ncbi:MAG TPA: hypothetical protein VGV59_05760 [Pyrinomonadaceae bacterium]|nr:hypothetical protein [Pyrinomonadaceae bacterium]